MAVAVQGLLSNLDLVQFRSQFRKNIARFFEVRYLSGYEVCQVAERLRLQVTLLAFYLAFYSIVCPYVFQSSLHQASGFLNSSDKVILCLLNF